MQLTGVFLACLLFSAFPALAGLSSTAEGPKVDEKLVVEPWPQADALFRKDSRWLGGDDAYSIDLGGGRVLWLFADSFIAKDASGLRRNAKLIRNSVAIQQGYNPASASIKYYWKGEDSNPESFFSQSGATWHWPGHGIKLGNRLLIFLMRVHQTSGDLGFAVSGWDALLVDNPHDEPSNWKMRPLAVEQNSFGIIVGSASILLQGQYVYAFSAQEASGHHVYLVRWPLYQVKQGHLSNPQWWTGGTGSWVSQSALKQKPEAVFLGGQTEFTVHYESKLKKFLQIQTEGFGDAELAMRWSKNLTGQWTALYKFYRPQEAKRPEALIYAGKAHPELRGADLVLTYVVNSKDFGILLNDKNLYYPKFLKCRITH